MRHLVFGPRDAQRRYILCYQALLFADASLARNELGAHISVLSKLEAIGVESNPDRPAGVVKLFGCPAGGEIALDDTEYELVKRFLGAFVPRIPGEMSRDMAAALAWIEKVGTKATAEPTSIENSRK